MSRFIQRYYDKFNDASTITIHYNMHIVNIAPLYGTLFLFRTVLGLKKSNRSSLLSINLAGKWNDRLIRQNVPYSV